MRGDNMAIIEDLEILDRIVKVQGCIIQGKHLKALLHKDRDFYLDKTNADVVTLCMNKQEKVYPEYVIEKHRLFAHLLHKYIFNNKTLSWDTFVQSHFQRFMSSKKCFQTSDIYDVFKGILTKREATSFNEELEMKHTIMMPMYDYERKDTIGIVCYVFCKDAEIDFDKLHNIKDLFQTLLQPLYNNETNIVHQRCVRVDPLLALLTDQEKRIAKKVLEGKPYAEIAKILNISINTLKTHMKNIFAKYEVNSKIELFNKLDMRKS